MPTASVNTTLPFVLIPAALWCVGRPAWRLVVAVRPVKDGDAESAPQSKMHRSSARGFILAAGLNLAASMVFGAALAWGGPPFFQGRTLTLLQLLALAIVLGAGLDALAALLTRTRPAEKTSSFFKTVLSPALTVAVALTLLGAVGYVRSTPGPARQALALDEPLAGRWSVATGGRTALTNHHHNHPAAQNSAVDLVRVDGPSQSEQVFAPCEGEVVQAWGDRPVGCPQPEGNLIVIRTKDGIDVWLAHLEQGSVQVAAGDRVRPGQPIARCGATGSAARAHLHIHAQKDGRPVPMLFGPRRRYLVRGDVLSN